MKRNLLCAALATMLLVAWLSFPATASAQGPMSWKWEWQIHQQVVKVINGVAYQRGENPMHYSAVAQQLRKQGYVESGWSSVGGTRVIYYYFTKTLALRAPIFPVILLAPTIYLRQNNPLFFETETT